MLNPDGVILGNSRCNVKGMDLNRAWQKPSLDMAREIYQLKKEILKCSSKIEMFIDLHAHSKKKNVFAYGNHDFRNPFATREFPYLLSRLSKKDFLFSECRFMKLNEERGKNKNSLNAELNTGK